MLHFCIEGERVGDDGGEVVGVGRRHDNGTDDVPAPPGERGRDPPPSSFSLTIPRWENGFPSGQWSPWRRRGRSPSEIGSLYLFPSVSALSDSGLSLFLKFPEIRNSDWAEILTDFFIRILSCFRRKKGTNRLTWWPQACQPRLV